LVADEKEKKIVWKQSCWSIYELTHAKKTKEAVSVRE
jgi:hypothetical protein